MRVVRERSVHELTVLLFGTVYDLSVRWQLEGVALVDGSFECQASVHENFVRFAISIVKDHNRNIIISVSRVSDAAHVIYIVFN